MAETILASWELPPSNVTVVFALLASENDHSFPDNEEWVCHQSLMPWPPIIAFKRANCQEAKTISGHCTGLLLILCWAKVPHHCWLLHRLAPLHLQHNYHFSSKRSGATHQGVNHCQGVHGTPTHYLIPTVPTEQQEKEGRNQILIQAAWNLWLKTHSEA